MICNREVYRGNVSSALEKESPIRSGSDNALRSIQSSTTRTPIPTPTWVRSAINNE
jgi:hypothetical protein